MHPPGSLPPLNPGGQIVHFHCTGCGQLLSVPAHLMGSTGPCPVCGTWLATPAAVPVAPQPQSPPAFTEAPSRPERRKRRTVLADANVDYRHSEQMQSLQALKIIGLAILVLAFCLAIAWFMKDWGNR